MLRTNVSAFGQCGRNVRWPWALDERTLLSLLWDRETDRQRHRGDASRFPLCTELCQQIDQSRGPIYKISYDLSYDYLKIMIVT